MDYSVPSKAFLLVQLLLLVSCLNLPGAFSQGGRRLWPLPPAYPPTEHHHERQHGQAYPPTEQHHASAHPPIHPPSHDHHDHDHHHGYAPSQSPVYFPIPVHHPIHHPLPYRRYFAVQGMVYCKSCQYDGKNALNGDAKPIPGAVVKLQCKNSRYPTEAMARTDEHGYFFLQAPKAVSTYAAHKCKVYLVSSPLPTCSLPSDLNGGVTGATLRLEEGAKLDFTLYSVGPFAFEPKCKL